VYRRNFEGDDMVQQQQCKFRELFRTRPSTRRPSSNFNFFLFFLMTDNRLRLLIALLGCEECDWVQPNVEGRHFDFNVLPRVQRNVDPRSRLLSLYHLFCVQLFSRHCIVTDKKFQSGLRFCCAKCLCLMFQDRITKGQLGMGPSYTVWIENSHSSTECSDLSPPSIFDDSLFGSDGRDMVGGAFLPALLGAVFIIKFPSVKYDKPSAILSADAMMLSLMNILQAEYGLSLSPNRLKPGLLKFLLLMVPTCVDSGDFRNDLKAGTGNDVNTYAQKIFFKLASSKTAQLSEAGAKAKANPRRSTMKTDHPAVLGSAHRRGGVGDSTNEKRTINTSAATADLDSSAVAVAAVGANLITPPLEFTPPLITPPLEFTPPLVWREPLFVQLKEEIARWATEAQSTGKPIWYWDLMSDKELWDVAAHAPTTVEELSAIETMKEREDNFVNEYGSQMVDIVRRFIEKEVGLEDYVNSRPMKRPIEHVMGLKESSPLKRPTVASGSTAKSPLDWSSVDQGQVAAAASNMNTPLIAADSSSGSDSMNKAAVTPHNNTLSGAVAAAVASAAVAVESAPAGDYSPNFAGDLYDEFKSSLDWSLVDQGQVAAAASNMNTPLIAADSSSGSDSMNEAAVTHHNNTLSGAVAAAVAVAVESVPAGDYSPILVGVVPQKTDTDTDVTDIENPASGETEKGGETPTQLTITIIDDSDSESDSETEMVRLLILCVRVCVRWLAVCQTLFVD
jgi:hypothetical protein